MDAEFRRENRRCEESDKFGCDETKKTPGISSSIARQPKSLRPKQYDAYSCDRGNPQLTNDICCRRSAEDREGSKIMLGETALASSTRIEWRGLRPAATSTEQTA